MAIGLPASAQELLVAAASDLNRAGPSLRLAFEKRAPVKVRITYGSSGQLARQIENGAPYDIYLSANDSYVNALTQAGHLRPDSVRTYALGRLGLWSADSKIRSLDGLVPPSIRHIAIANPSHAPYGVAAKEALKRIWSQLEGRIVYGENVLQAFQFAETGNAEAAVTAWSLVHDRGGLLLPAALHSPIRQTGGVVASSRHVNDAARFVAFLTSPEARAILKKSGFDLPARP
ncbi:MAG: molybdate ABC transporter substrate-binding protein [Bryobacteraceae bacterium]